MTGASRGIGAAIADTLAKACFQTLGKCEGRLAEATWANYFAPVGHPLRGEK